MNRRSRPTSRLVVVLAAAAVLSTACSGVPNVIDGAARNAGGSDRLVAGDPGTGDGLGAGGDEFLGDATPGEGGALPEEALTDGPLSGGGEATGIDGSGSGSSGGGGTGSGNGSPSSTGGQAPTGGANGSPQQQGKGISDQFITIAIHGPLSSYENDQAREAFRERADTYVKWFNKYVAYPGGRKLKHTIVDNCGPRAGCEDQARAAGLKIAKEIKAFASLGNSVNPGADQPIVADITTRSGTLEIGTNFQTENDLKGRAPFAYSVFGVPERSFDYLSWFAAKRFKDAPYVSDEGAKSKRVWGSVFFDGKADRTLSALSAKQMSRFGISVKQFFISGDPGTGAQQASSLVLQMKNAGINSIVFGASREPGVAYANASSQSRYYPDFFVTGYGDYIGQAVFNPLYGNDFTRRLYAAEAPVIVAARLDIDPKTGECPACQIQDNGDAFLKAYRQAGGKAKQPTDDCGCGVDIWYQLSTLSIGLIKAGNVLNAATFARGLSGLPQDRCNVTRFFGRDHPQVSRIGYAPGIAFGFTGMTTYYWVNKPNRVGTVGYFESFDNYKRFDSFKELPASASFDTGKRGEYPLTKQKQTTSPDKPC